MAPDAPFEPIVEPITIGKDVLELVTGAMYADPLSIYREYIQNAADAIDEGRAAGLFGEKDPLPKVSITINREARSITITDNGVGVPNAEFVARLTAIGGSQKRGGGFRGFRGVGRLSGLGYCQELIFRSRGQGDKKVSEVHWDGRRLKEVLRDAAFGGGLAEAIRAVAKTKKSVARDVPHHFFEVELRKVTRVKNDVLLNEDVVRNYLAQVGPVPFHPEFSLGAEIQEYLATFSTGASFAIELNDGRGMIYRPFRDEIQVTEKQRDHLHSPEFFKIPGVHEGVAAVGWILHHSYFGAWPRRFGIGGIRARLGNLQIGGSDFFTGQFVEPRFNQWCVAEVHVLTDKLVPNGRRDDFEYSSHYDNFLGQIAPKLSELSKICRERSELRQKLKTANQYVQRARQALIAIKARNASAIVRKVAEWQCSDSLKGLEHTAKARALSESERSLILSERSRLMLELQRHVARYVRRDPFATVAPRRRKDIEGLIRLVFERIKDQKKAEDFAKRVVRSFR
jgi:molecular chaperone HtpG